MPMRKWIRWIPAILCMLLIFYFSHQPGGKLGSYVPFFQRWFPAMRDFNWGHFAAYFVLACTVYWGLGERWANVRGRLLTVIVCTLYGITDEFHQMFVPDRTADWLDVRNDAIGAALAMLLLSLPPVSALYRKVLGANKYYGRTRRNHPNESENIER